MGKMGLIVTCEGVHIAVATSQKHIYKINEVAAALWTSRYPYNDTVESFR